jgi:hypothetical protein
MPNLLLPGNIRSIFTFCKLTSDFRSGNEVAELLNNPLHRLRLFFRTIFRLRQSVGAVCHIPKAIGTERRRVGRRFRFGTTPKLAEIVGGRRYFFNYLLAGSIILHFVSDILA